MVRNPFNYHQVSRYELNPDTTDCIVFWTKDPKPMLKRLDEIRDFSYYFQFTITGYGKDVEPNVPDKKTDLIQTFRQLSSILGPQRVIWRFDPIFLSPRYTMEYQLRAFRQIAEALDGYTDRCVISFIDLYTKTIRNTQGLELRAPTTEEMQQFAAAAVPIANQHGITVESCAEKIDLDAYGIEHGSCIDGKRIESIIGCRLQLPSSKPERDGCRCIPNIDIGTFNTCGHRCRYCYANYSETAIANMLKAYDPDSPLLCSELTEEDKITDHKMKSFKDIQMSLFDL